MRGTSLQVHKLERPVARRRPALLAALVASAFFFFGAPAGTAHAAGATPPWPYTATVTSGPGRGQTVNLAHLNNISLEQLGARVVGTATLHVGVAGSPYRCLDGTTLNVFSFAGQLFVHNGLQGAQCAYGTWEVAPLSLTSPAQAPVIAKMAVAANGTPNFVAYGRNFGSEPGTVSLIGYSATYSGPVYRAKVLYWSATTVAFAANALAHGNYDVLLLTGAGAAATTLFNYGSSAPAPLWAKEPSPTAQALNSVSCVPGTGPAGVQTGYCYAVGDKGTVLFSANGGLTWSLEASPVKVDLNGVTCLPLALPGMRVPVWCWAVGDQGTILFTKNGLPWAAAATGLTSDPLSAVACQANYGRCWAVGTAVAAEFDPAFGGDGWRLITVLGPAGSTCGPGGPQNACLRGVAVGNTDEHFAVGGGGNIYDQFDYQGQNWSNTVSLGAGYFTSVSCGPQSADGHSHCITVGTDDSLAASRIYVTFDSGASWAPAASPPEGALPVLRGVSVLRGASATGLAWAVGDQGTILATNNGGRTWAKEASPTSANLLGVTCPNLVGPRVLCVAVGAGGTILTRRLGLPISSSWPYTATVTSGPGRGQTVNLAHLNNISLEQLGARVVGTATLHVGVAGSPYRCLDGTSLNVFSFDGQLFVHNGLQGAQCAYGTWEIVPRSVTSPGQLPVITNAYVALSPLCATPPVGCGRVVVSGRGFGPSPGTLSLIGYSASTSGPVVVTPVRSWAPGKVVGALQGALAPGHYYDVLLFTTTGAAATTLVEVPRVVPLSSS